MWLRWGYGIRTKVPLEQKRAAGASRAIQPKTAKNRRLNLNSAIGCEQQRREDAKKELGNGKFGGGFGFTCQVKVSDFGEMASIALFSAFASSCLRCSTAASRLNRILSVRSGLRLMSL